MRLVEGLWNGVSRVLSTCSAEVVFCPFLLWSDVACTQCDAVLTIDVRDGSSLLDDLPPSPADCYIFSRFESIRTNVFQCNDMTLCLSDRHAYTYHLLLSEEQELTAYLLPSLISTYFRKEITTRNDSR